MYVALACIKITHIKCKYTIHQYIGNIYQYVNGGVRVELNTWYVFGFFSLSFK